MARRQPAARAGKAGAGAWRIPQWQPKIGPDGLRAVLDWEVAYLGDPIKDLGWICVGPWRFGGIDKPVGDFCTYEELVAGYEAGGGGKESLEHIRFWEALGSTSWCIACSAMTHIFRDSADPTADRAMIARRTSENEIDLMNLLAQGADMQDTPDHTEILAAVAALQLGYDAAERQRLKALLGGRDGALEALNQALCEAIERHAITLETPGLAEHLWVTTMAKLAVDQPSYARYERELTGH
jgi:hypothetical protein